MAALADDVRAALDAAADRVGPFSRRIAVYDVIGSTNEEAIRLAGLGAPEGTAVIADTQTAGRGRAGRLWFSPPGVGLYVSVVLRPDHRGAGASSAVFAPWTRFITLGAGVAVADGIRSATGLPVAIKWPNDVVIDDGSGPRAAERRSRKLAGILAEASGAPTAPPHIVVGFGINVGAARYPGELMARATSLEAEAGRPIDRGVVLVETLAAFARRYAEIGAGRIRDVLTRWRELSPSSSGARVILPRAERAVHGTTAGLGDNGALRVRTAAGIEEVVSGEVTWV